MQVTLIHLTLPALQPSASRPQPQPPAPHNKQHSESELAASTLATDRSVRKWLVGQIPPNYASLERCYSSVTDDTRDATAFHKQCDHHNRTLVLVRNLVNGTRRLFGGFAAVSWDPLITCVKPGNDQGMGDGPPLTCTDRTSEWTSFIFSLSPGDPVRFNHCHPCTVVGIGNTHETLFISGVGGMNSWPAFMNDLTLSHGELGERAFCRQGPSYLCDGSQENETSRVQTTCFNKICGGDKGTWRETELEVWGLAV